jgi:hypothetical protein
LLVCFFSLFLTEFFLLENSAADCAEPHQFSCGSAPIAFRHERQKFLTQTKGTVKQVLSVDTISWSQDG